MKKSLPLLLLLLPAAAISQMKHGLDQDRLYINGLHGDVQTIMSVLDTATGLSADDLKFKEKYRKRFELVTDTYQVVADDAIVQGIIDIYSAYWRAVLLKTTDKKEADKGLETAISRFLKLHDPKNDKPGFQTGLKSFLEGRGYHCTVGRTGAFYDLILWKKDVEESYTVVLPAETVKVKVVFLDGIKTMGWEDYATFGKYYPGGWAKSDRLYCVKSAYDLESEKFRVSFLAHETQHFADYKKYSDLSSPGLEYRAKLTELILSKDTTLELIKKFIATAKNDRSNPHGFANQSLIVRLSEKLWDGDSSVSDLERWKELPPQSIKEAAKVLLAEHSAALDQGNDLR